MPGQTLKGDFMILNLVLNLFRSKRTAVATPPSKEQLPVQEEMTAEQIEAEHDAIVSELMEAYRNFRTLCRKECIRSSKDRSWKNTGNHKMLANETGLQIVRDDDGKIVKTRDALRRVREYRYDAESGDLEINKFGIWNKLERAKLSDTGTLTWRSAERETVECLDGTIICISFRQKNLIAHNERTGEEVTIVQGRINHLFRKEGVQTTRTFANGSLTESCERYETPANYTTKTMAGEHTLEAVSRIERTFENDKLACERIAFLDLRTGANGVRISLELPTGELHLSRVRAVENRYKDGVLVETIFELSEPVSVSRDKEGNVSLLQGIKKVRSLQMHDGVCSIVFIDHNGDENVFFPAI